MKVRFKGFALASLALLLLNFGLASLNTAFAATDPTVSIAVDTTTSSNCTAKITRNYGTPQASTTSSPCSVGSIISSKNLTLSEALKLGEKYVVVPDKLASAQAISKYDADLANLLKAKGEALKPSTKSDLAVKSNIVRPNATACGQSTQIEYGWVPYWKDFDIYSDLVYTMASNCANVTLNYATQIDGTGPSEAYWGSSKYASGSWSAGCHDIYTQQTQNINSVQPIGYYFEPWTYQGPTCSGLSGSVAYVNMGPVN